MIGIGIGLNYGNPVSSAVAAWTPASLTGLLFQIEADTAKLWKATNGTGAVSLDGDDVQRIDNKAGAGFFTVVTGTCTYRTNSGKPKLVFSACALKENGLGVVLTDGSGQHSSGASASFSTNTGVQVIWDADNSSTSPRLSQFLRNNVGVAESIAFNTVPTAFTDTGASLVAGTPATLIEVTTTAAVEMFVDNVSGGSTAVTGTLQSAAAIPAIGGANYASPAGLFTGDLYSIVHASGTITPTERGNLHTYLASKHP